MRKLGLIAGNGKFPLIFAEQARREGVELITVAHRGETSKEIYAEVDAVTWVRVGQLGRTIRAFRGAGVERAVMAGGIDKVRSLLSIRPDWTGLRALRNSRAPISGFVRPSRAITAICRSCAVSSSIRSFSS